MKRLTIAVATSAVLIGACADPGLPRAVADDLQRRVHSIRLAVETGEVGTARGRLDALAADVAALLERGAIDEAKAGEILDAAEVVRASLRLAPTAVATQSSSPSPVDEQGHGSDKDKDKDEGQGNDD
jgi:hypothetical protein